jgi:hypothetical protein
MMPPLFDNDKLIQKVRNSLDRENSYRHVLPVCDLNFAASSSVLLLLGTCPDSSEICLILNKRSEGVRQPGDLCCPGGGIRPRTDRLLSGLLRLPLMPLAKWPHWKTRYRDDPQTARTLAVLLTTGLRESFEEMRLNPLGVKFLGLLPPQSLVMFERVIYPLVAWVNRQRRFRPNWEVEKIVFIRLTELLKPDNYARYRLDAGDGSRPDQDLHASDFPCFRHHAPGETEILWGATYQIISAFLKSVFDFSAPGWSTMPVVNGSLNDNYLTGSR